GQARPKVAQTARISVTASMARIWTSSSQWTRCRGERGRSELVFAKVLQHHALSALGIGQEFRYGWRIDCKAFAVRLRASVCQVFLPATRAYGIHHFRPL